MNEIELINKKIVNAVLQTNTQWIVDQWAQNYIVYLIKWRKRTPASIIFMSFMNRLNPI